MAWNSLPLIFPEILLGSILMFALLWLAYILVILPSFAERQAVAVILARFFAWVFIFNSVLKGVFFFFGFFGASQYFIASHGTLLLSSFLNFTAGCVLLFSGAHIKGNLEQHLLEYPLLFGLGLWFLGLLLHSNHFLVTLIGLLGFSLSLYAMIMCFNPQQRLIGSVADECRWVHSGARQEAGMKYFYLSSFSLSLIVLSLTLVFLATQSLNFLEVSRWFAFAWQALNVKGFLLAVLLAGFAFKVSAFPAHFWAPEVYHGSATPVTAFIMLPVKIGSLGGLLFVLNSCFFEGFMEKRGFLVILAVGSLIAGACGAFIEVKIKKFLAYSSINQIGFILLGFALAPEMGAIQASLLFLLVYMLTNTLFFCFFLNFRKSPLIYLTDLKQGSPLVRMAWTFVFLSFAGFPPFAGFFTKFYIFISVCQPFMWVPLIIGILTSLVSAYYYLRIIKLLWFDGDVVVREERSLAKEEPSWREKGFALTLMGFTALFVLGNEWLLTVCRITSFSAIYSSIPTNF